MFVYNSEINCRIEWLWDSGFTWCLLDNSYPRILKDEEFDNSSKIISRTEKDWIKANNITHEKDWIARGCEEDIDDALGKLFDAIIEHYPTSTAAIKLKDFDENREHFLVCTGCGDLFDCRDLSDVFSHEHSNEKLQKLDVSKYKKAKRKDDSNEWIDGKKINLN